MNIDEFIEKHDEELENIIGKIFDDLKIKCDEFELNGKDTLHFMNLIMCNLMTNHILALSKVSETPKMLTLSAIFEAIKKSLNNYNNIDN